MKITYSPRIEYDDDNEWTKWWYNKIIIYWALAIWSFFALSQWYVIAIKSLSLGKYSFLIAGIIFVRAFIDAIREKMIESKNQKILENIRNEWGQTISIDNDSFTFPYIKKWTLYTLTIPCKSAHELWKRWDEEWNESQIIILQDEYYKNNKKKLLWEVRFQWHLEDFWSESDYRQFENFLNRNCVNITNRWQ